MHGIPTPRHVANAKSRADVRHAAMRTEQRRLDAGKNGYRGPLTRWECAALAESRA